MEGRATETVEFLKLFDNLFDSLNDYQKFNRNGKILRTRVKCIDADEDNIRVQYLLKARAVISTFCAEGNKKTVPPTFKNWVLTINNFIALRKRLKNLGFLNFKPRFLNQDPLGNFFR